MRSKRGDEGSMLIELIVAMMLSAIVGTMVLNAVITGMQGQRQLQDRGQALAEGRTAVQRLSRDIRQSDPLLGVTGTTLALSYTPEAGGTVTKTWTLDTVGGVTMLDLVTQVTSASGVVGAKVPTTLIRSLDPTAVPFSVNPVPGWTPPSGSTVSPTTCAIPGSSPVAYAPDCVGTITVHIVRLVTAHSPVTVDTTVDLRNNL